MDEKVMTVLGESDDKVAETNDEVRDADGVEVSTTQWIVKFERARVARR